VLHGTPEWSRNHKELTPPKVGRFLLDRLLLLSGFDYEVDIIDCDARLWKDAFCRNPPPGNEALLKEARATRLAELVAHERGNYGKTGVDGCLFDPAKGIGYDLNPKP
jgi:hypothetical protein